MPDDIVIPISAPPLCPYCGSDAPLVPVSGHEQCRDCGAVVNRCCDE